MRLNATAHGRRNRIMKALVISGVGRYADPWHDFAGTSQRLAELLGGMGLDAEVATLGTEEPPADPVDLLVVNAGGGSTPREVEDTPDRKSTRLNSSHVSISYAFFCLKKKKNKQNKKS